MYYTPGWGAVITAAVGIVGVSGTVTGAWLGQRATRKVAEDNHQRQHEDQLVQAASEFIKTLQEFELATITASQIIADTDDLNTIDFVNSRNERSMNITTGYLAHRTAGIKLELIAPNSIRQQLREARVIVDNFYKYSTGVIDKAQETLSHADFTVIEIPSELVNAEAKLYTAIRDFRRFDKPPNWRTKTKNKITQTWQAWFGPVDRNA